MVKHLAWIPALTLATMMPLQSSAQVRSYSDAGKAEFDAFLARAVRETHVPGLVAMVVGKDGVIYQGAFGDRDVARGRPVTMDSIFRIVSMTKPITSVAVMMLVEAGQLDLDDPVSMHLPRLLSDAVFETFDRSDNSYTTRPREGEVTVRLHHSPARGQGHRASSAHAYLGPRLFELQ